MKYLRILLHTIKIFIVFTLCMLFFYFGLVWINEEYQNYNRYHQPEGKAIKVNSPNEIHETPSTVIDRVKLFFKLAE